MRKKQKLNILLLAADLLSKENERFCCLAIEQAARLLYDMRSYDSFEVVELFASVFKRKSLDIDSEWMRDTDEHNNEEVHSRRILALLFCAHLLEIGEI